MARSRITLDGLPHSEISGSKPVCGSPELIAAYHVLHRRPAPRHPPYALSSLTTTFTLLENVAIGTSYAYASLLLSSVVNEPGPSARQQLGRYRPASVSGGPPLGPGPITWWSWPGSNRRPPPCKGGALPVELQPRTRFGTASSPLEGWWA